MEMGGSLFLTMILSWKLAIISFNQINAQSGNWERWETGSMLSHAGEKVFTKKSDALKVKFLAQAVSLQESQKNETTLPLSALCPPHLSFSRLCFLAKDWAQVLGMLDPWVAP